MGYKGHNFKRVLRVDTIDTHGDFSSVKDACDFAATITPRDQSNYVLIEVNAGAFVESPFTIPSWVIVHGIGGAGEDQIPCTGIANTTVVDSDTEFITMEANSSINNCSIGVVPLPANMLADFAVIRCEGEARLRENRVFQLGAPYTGTNTVSLIAGDGAVGDEISLYRNRFVSSGSSVTTIKSDSIVVVEYCQFIGAPDVCVDCSGSHVSLRHSTMKETETGGAQAITYDLVAGVGTEIRLTSTRIPLDRRTGGSTTFEEHPTPQQIETAVRATVKSVAINTTIDGYADGTIIRTAGDVTLPLSADVITGQSFIIANEGGTSMSVLGNGGTIDGSASITLDADNLVIIQNVGSGLWRVIASSTNSVIMGDLAIDDDVVHIAGAETITGSKTFANMLTYFSDPAAQIASAGNINFMRLVAGKSKITLTANGAFVAELFMQYGNDVNASNLVTQQATSTQYTYGTSISNVFFNVDNKDLNIILRGSTDDNLLATDGSNDSVGVGTSVTDASAKFQVDSDDKGSLPFPRMTTTERDAIVSPATFLTIANETTGCVEYYTGSVWACLLTSGTGALTEKSWTFSSPAGASGVSYSAGFYDFGSSNDDFSPTINFGTADNPYAAHFFIVLGSAPVDTLTIRVTGTSINDSGTRVTSDTQDIVVDTGDATDDYFETGKKWLGQVAVSIVSGTPVQCNYGFSKYWDNSNMDYTIKGWEATWVGGANDSGADIEVIHHKPTGWTYNVGSTPSPPTAVGSMATDHGTESDVKNNESGAWKRTNISEVISGSTNEGFILKVTTSANKTYEIANFLLSITV